MTKEEVIEKLIELFEGDKKFVEYWMSVPHKVFDGVTPLELMETEGGREKIVQVINQLDDGIVL